MRIRNYFFLLFSTQILFFGCKNEDQSIWDHETTIEIFTEAQLIESKLSFHANDSKKDSLSMVYYDHLFAKFHTNQKEFDSVLQFYTNHPEKMEEIYTEIITKLTLIQTQEKNNSK